MSKKLNKVLLDIEQGILLKTIDLSNCNLKEFPIELLKCCNTLEYLNLGNNSISSLPNEFIRFQNLRILFFGSNEFTEIPVVLGKLTSLYMLSFKSNKVNYIHPESLSKSISWLILTDNHISELPSTIGNLILLKKVMLAGNKLKSLPKELINCQTIELLRISANLMDELPLWLLELPNLSWFAYAGNPIKPLIRCNHDAINIEHDCNNDTISTIENHMDDDIVLTKISWSDLNILERLGEGASGYIHKATWSSNKHDKYLSKPTLFHTVNDINTKITPIQTPQSSNNHIDNHNNDDILVKDTNERIVAIKLFKGTTTSDGLPEYEMKTTSTIGYHPNFINVLGILDTNTAPNQQLGLIFPLIDHSIYNILGDPPSFDTITRDTFPLKKIFSLSFIFNVLIGIASACIHLHQRKYRSIMHGDLYAHNILVQSDGTPLLTDFGASSFYDQQYFTTKQCELLERIEIKAYGCLVEDLILQCTNPNNNNNANTKHISNIIDELNHIKLDCFHNNVIDRPNFSIIYNRLVSLNQQFVSNNK